MASKNLSARKSDLNMWDCSSKISKVKKEHEICAPFLTKIVTNCFDFFTLII